MDTPITPKSQRLPAVPPPTPVDRSTVDLVREAVDAARDLVKVEVELAKDELRHEIADARKAAIAFGAASVTAILGLAVLLMALVLVLGGTAMIALIVGLALMVIAGGVAFFGYKKVPRKPLDETRERLEHDLHDLKERIA